MKILVVGCGKIGTAILASLAAEGHEITVIDTSQSVLDEITNIHDVMSVCGNGADCDTLKEAGAPKADLVVSVTHSDEMNMLTCFLAGKMGAKHTIARIRNPEYNDESLDFLKQQLGLSMAINPEYLAAQELYHMLKLPTAAKVESFSRGNFEMLELKLKGDSPLLDATLSELRNRYKAKFLIGVVQRGSEVYIPDGNFILRDGDRIGLLASHSEIQKLLRSMGVAQKQARNVMIIGGSRTGIYLAKRLILAGNSVRIIEIDRKLCDELTDALPKAVIINGDGAKQELLKEVGLANMDAFVTLTDMDEENILLAFFAESQKVPKVIAKVGRDEISSLAERLGLESIVSPRKIITDVLLRYARALQNSMGSNIETLYTLMDDQAEAAEFNVLDQSRLVNIPLKDLRLKPNILIAGIIRNRTPFIPTGSDVILPGDKVVVLAAKQHLLDLADILK
ncbi:MAG: Trk system potassium transporter TrkA [Eubacteriales bacterium]